MQISKGVFLCQISYERPTPTAKVAMTEVVTQDL